MFQITLTFIHVLKNTIIEPNGAVYYLNTKAYGTQCYAGGLARNKKYPPEDKQGDFKIYDEVFTITQSWGYGFFHYTIENLVRLPPFMKFLVDNPSVKVHLIRNSGFVKKLIQHFNIDPDRIITGVVRARIVYVPQNGPCGKSIPFNARLQSLIHRSLLTKLPEPRKSIILIKRSTKRWFHNHKSILENLQTLANKYNYNVEVYDDKHIPSTMETMEIFNRAFMVVAPHGAGESNLLFSEPGTILVEGLCHPVNLCYRNVATSLGHIYYGFYYEKENCKNVRPEQFMSNVEFYMKRAIIA